MNLDYTEDELLFRDEVRTWLNENKPKEPLPPPGLERLAYEKAWQKKLYDGGWAGISWPKEYGGCGFSLMKQLIWFEEVTLAHAPAEGIFFVALNHAGPTVIALGSPEQKQKYLPQILRGETPWCQGFSEPDAGSDLAALRTTGDVDGDSIVINGTKIWSTGAHLSDYQELVIRTERGSQRHAGLSWVICDMHLPGVDVRPIRSLDGEVHFCEVFYDNVRIPLDNVVGGLHNGWKTAMTTLSFERGTATLGERMGVAWTVEQLIRLARATIDETGQPAIESGNIGERLATARAEAAALRAMTYMTISRGMRDPMPGPEGVIAAIYATELVQRVHELATDIMGLRALEMDGGDRWPRRYLASRLRTLAGGTSQIRRNIVGERLLGLPRGR